MRQFFAARMRQMTSAKPATSGEPTRRLGVLMREARQSLRPHGVRLDQRRVGKLIALSRHTIQRWEGGSHKPRIDQLENYLKALVKHGLSPARAQTIFRSEFPNIPISFVGVAEVETNQSIAILRFSNPDGDRKLDVMAYGLALDIADKLSSLSELTVIWHEASFNDETLPADHRATAKELGVGYILSGAVRRSKKQVRINIHLTEGSTNREIWREHYDKTFNRNVSEISNVQDEIVQKAVDALLPHVGRPQKREHEMPASFEAWEAAIRALILIDDRSKANLLAATNLVDEALRKEPSYAFGHAIRAYVTILRVHYRFEDRLAGVASSLKSSLKALEINQNEAWAHMTLGFVRLHERSMDESITCFQRALSLNSNLSMAYTGYGAVLCYLGKGKEALEQIDLASPRLSSRSRVHSSDLGTNANVRASASFVLRRYEDGIKFAKQAISENPRILTAYSNMILNCALAGDIAEAKRALVQISAEMGPLSLKFLRESMLYTRPDDRRRFIYAYRLAGLE